MSDDQRHPELGQVVRISGDVPAAGAVWEMELQRALLEDGEALPGDEALLDSLCSSIGLAGTGPGDSAAEVAARERRREARCRLRSALRYAAFAAVLLLSLSALAVLRSHDDARPSNVASGADVSPGPARPAPPRQQQAATPAAPLASPPPLASGSHVEAASPTAAQLFALAKRAQRAGDMTLAIARFERLQQRFPASAEAHVSHVVLGSLWMKRGAAGRGLQEFQAYLARGGVLGEEALAGQARAFAALGRKSEEARAWQTLLEKYPKSVQAEYAAARLERLRGPR